ncbi:MAG TPA: patatin-like phospholipase family protein [Steroidobacteraceae bacterium]|jgi:NTE family protein|nr:patatin-like phospholipase family protein [Steroidobacteraceae bacterium]
MLTLEPARRGRPARTKIALALAGGGPLGAFYELGALHALSEAIEGRELVDFDVYTGVSSGALIAAGLANGFDTTTMAAAFIDEGSSELPFSPAILLQPAINEYGKRLRQLPAVLARAAQQYMRDPMSGAWSTAVGSVGRIVPAAVFDNEPLEEYLRALFTLPGHTDDFRELRGRLYVVATNLNTGEPVHFGGRAHDRVPISRAVLASAALPGLYAPVKIGGQYFVDGALVRTMNASLALGEGCNLVFCVNPLVPFDASRAKKRAHTNIADEGLPAILSQTFRSLIYSRMKVGRASYRARYPSADQLLLEPDRHDERLFFANVFRYAGRRRLAEHAYQCTRRDLLRQADAVSRMLARHGLRLNQRVLKERKRSLSTAASERRAHGRRALHGLDHALRELESLIPTASAGH